MWAWRVSSAARLIDAQARVLLQQFSALGLNSSHPPDSSTVTLPGSSISAAAIYVPRRGVRTRFCKPKMKDLPRKPTFDYSGDLNLELPSLGDNETVFTSIGLDIEEIAAAQDSIYSIHNAAKPEQMELIRTKTIAKFGRHEFDQTSLEVRIAFLTTEIRNMIRHCQQFPKDKRSKSIVIEKIHLRRKRLRELFKTDTKKFNWVCDELQIKYIPKPKYDRYIPLRSRRRAEAIQDMMAVKQRKLDELKASLEKERDEYYMHREEVLASVKAEAELLEKHREELKTAQVQTGYEHCHGETGLKLADPTVIKREKWWRKTPAVLKMKYGSAYKPARENRKR